MTQTAIALYTFASSFTWPAYPEDSVPSSADLPYITYTLQEYDWDSMGMMQMRLWYKGADYATINAKIDDISNSVKNGYKVNTSSGAVCIYKGSPWCQYQPSDEVDLKIAYLNFNVHYTTN
ncbi:MAG: hypothetical protein IKQ46_10580 [Bacteroidales bacterium]|nr:hypothetical protein [Bacteroidales bacterium]